MSLNKRNLSLLRKVAQIYSKRSRKKRARIFLQYLNPQKDDKILDLGGGDGSHLASIIPYRKNVYIADILSEKLSIAKDVHGFEHIVLLDESGKLDFPDQFFDILFSSSVIEHVTVRKDEVGAITSTREFSNLAYLRQKHFASELRRVAKRYFVQTPNKNFPIESHSWQPAFIVWLPRRLQIGIFKFFNAWWPKKVSSDWHLLTIRQMRELFSDSTIVLEKSFGFTKSIMAIKHE